MQNLTAPTNQHPNRRDQRRYFLSNPGRLVAPFADVECTLINISGTAAKLAVSCDVEVGDSVALDIDAIGCFRATVLRVEEQELIVEFELDPARRQRLLERIEDYLKSRAPL